MSDDIDTRVVASFAPERYEEILHLMCDRALLPHSYAAWRHGFEERIAELHRRAIRPIVVEIDPAAFWAWCAAEDWPCDAQARLEYAEWLASVGRAPWSRHDGRLRDDAGLSLDDWNTGSAGVVAPELHDAAA